MPPKNLSAFIRAEMQTRFRRCVLDQAMLSVTWLLPVFQLLTAQENVALGVGFLILFQTQVEYMLRWDARHLEKPNFRSMNQQVEKAGFWLSDSS